MALTRQICPKCVFAIDPKNDLHTELKKQLRRSPPMAVGMAVYENSSTNQLGIEALFNGAAIHSPPMAISLVTNALLGKECKYVFLHYKNDLLFFSHNPSKH
jgi:hypothetical protein